MSEKEERPYVPPLPEYVEKAAPINHLIPEAPQVPISVPPSEPIPQHSAPIQHLVPPPPPQEKGE